MKKDFPGIRQAWTVIGGERTRPAAFLRASWVGGAWRLEEEVERHLNLSSTADGVGDDTQPRWAVVEVVTG